VRNVSLKERKSNKKMPRDASANQISEFEGIFDIAKN